jgi:hypothetical protein
MKKGLTLIIVSPPHDGLQPWARDGPIQDQDHEASEADDVDNGEEGLVQNIIQNGTALAPPSLLLQVEGHLGVLACVHHDPIHPLREG